MFDGLSENLAGVFDRLKKRGALTEAEVGTALREVRQALLEADVALPVVKDLIHKVRLRALGQEVIASVTPGQQVVKIVHDELVKQLGGEAAELDLRGEPPHAILMVGLQGSGKTTTTAKLAKRLSEREKKRVLMASLDVQRPAAQQQLAQLGEQIGVDTLAIVAGQPPETIAKRALETARKQGYDAVLLDTAGRLSIDDALMDEVSRIRDIAQPRETLLVADALTGQDAVTTAQNFNDRVGLSGIVLTRLDGDGRGGAALSMRAITGQPIKLAGMGERPEDLEPFDPSRIANRILGYGDVVSLVEKAQETVEEDEAQKLEKKLAKGKFDLDDMASQFQQMRKMGGMGALAQMMPGMGKMKKQIDQAGVDDKMLKRQEAIISSMTKAERRNPKLLNAKRKKRIAAGAGRSVQEVNRLLKQYEQMRDTMKKMKKQGKKGMQRHGIPNMPQEMMPPGQGGSGGGLPPMGGR